MRPSIDRPVRLLLVNPVLPESFWSFRWWVEMAPGKRAINLPLGLTTLAALCPPHWQVRIVDETVQSLPLEPEADLVGVCGMGTQLARQSEILRYYRSLGMPTVAGGSFASLCPERYAELADFVVAGEAGHIWPCSRSAGPMVSRSSPRAWRPRTNGIDWYGLAAASSKEIRTGSRRRAKRSPLSSNPRRND